LILEVARICSGTVDFSAVIAAIADAGERLLTQLRPLLDGIGT
jgi:hypothetical protein